MAANLPEWEFEQTLLGGYGHPAYRLRRLRRVHVRGYSHLNPYAVQRAVGENG